jgi:hypothetical protein
MKKLRRNTKRAVRNDYRPPRIGKSEGNLTARRETTAGTQSKGKHKEHHPDTNAGGTPSDKERKARFLLEEILTASRRIEQKLVRNSCLKNEWNLNQNKDVYRQLVLACMSINSHLLTLAIEFQEPFREIAEELPAFPTLFPAHADHQLFIREFVLNRLNLGKRYALKLRAASGRKTFSTKTWVNKLLTDLIHMDEVPFTPENPKQWLDAIWERLLIVIPNPERHPRLRQLAARPSLRTKRMRCDGTVGEKTQAHNMRAAIKAKLGEYVKRMLTDSTVTQIATQFGKDS